MALYLLFENYIDAEVDVLKNEIEQILHSDNKNIVDDKIKKLKMMKTDLRKQMVDYVESKFAEKDFKKLLSFYKTIRATTGRKCISFIKANDKELYNELMKSRIHSVKEGFINDIVDKVKSLGKRAGNNIVKLVKDAAMYLVDKLDAMAGELEKIEDEINKEYFIFDKRYKNKEVADEAKVAIKKEILKASKKIVESYCGIIDAKIKIMMDLKEAQMQLIATNANTRINYSKLN